MPLAIDEVSAEVVEQPRDPAPPAHASRTVLDPEGVLEILRREASRRDRLMVD